MDKKIITLLILLIFSIGCLSFVSADNNTTDNVEIEDNLTDYKENLTDIANYIIPVYITDNGIEFSDGFTGFCIDSSKDVITTDDRFISQNTKNEEIENNVKLAIIECYKAGKENDIQNVISQVLNGNRNYDVVESVLNSQESVDDTAVVNINNTTEATFTFELLKPVDDGKSDCLAYKVSLKTIANDDMLSASNETVENAATNNTSIENRTVNNSTTKDDNVSDTKQTNTNQTIINNTTINNTNNTHNNQNNTTIIVNQNNTHNNQNNTTIIVNQNNTKVINKTNDAPKNTPLQQKIMRAVGNPITILVIVIVIIAIVAVIIRKKD